MRRRPNERGGVLALPADATQEPEPMQVSVLALLKLYEQGSFEIDPEFPDLPDPVAVALELLYLLTHQQNQAAARGAAGRPSPPPR